MTQFDFWLERLARRVRWGEFLHRVANWLAVYLLAAGTIVLMGKLAVPRQSWPGPLEAADQQAVAWLLGLVVLGGALPVGVTWWLSQRSRMTRVDLVAWLDRRLDAGGLLMTLSETPDSSWNERLPVAEAAWKRCLPQVRPRRFTRQLLVPVVFLVIACAMPWRTALPGTVLRDTVGQRETGELVRLLEELKEAGILEEEEQEQLDEAIEQLAADTRREPLTHEKWETVDTLRERMQMKLDSANLSVQKALESIKALEELEFDKSGAPLDEKHAEQLRQDIEEALKKITQGKSPGDLPESLKELARRLKRQQEGQKSGGREGQSRQFQLPRDAAQRQQALQELQEFLQQESQRLQELRQQAQRNPGGT